MEIKRATGRTMGTDSGGRKLTDLAVVTPLPMADNTPDAPEFLGKNGKELWERAWASAITWFSPQSDWDAIVNAAKLADAVEAARGKYLATLEAADARAYTSINKAFVDSLSSLGFDPTSRSRLGVAEVKKMSVMDQLIAKRNSR